MAPGVCVASFRVFLRSSDLLRFRVTSPNAASNVSRSFLDAETPCGYRGRSRYSSTRASSSTPPASSLPSSSSSSSATVPPEQESTDEVTVKYIQGLPHITVPLPSRQEKCRFALKPVSHKVHNLIEMLKLEDRGIDRATVINTDGIRIASSCSIQSLMDETFWLEINDKKYKVEPPKRSQISADDLERLGDVKAIVGQLYEALHVGEFHIKKEEELQGKLEDLKYELIPYEEKKAELHAEAERKDTILQWAALGYMSLQFGVLARLTWWEYSWDIMEPVTYFVTYGTAMCAYAYYVTTKTEYTISNVKDRQYLIEVHARAKKKNFDVETYNSIKRQIYDLEYDLRRLRDPLNLQLAPHLGKGSIRRGGKFGKTDGEQLALSSILPPAGSSSMVFRDTSKSRSPINVLKELVQSVVSWKKNSKP